MRGRSLLLDLYELTMAASYFARKVKLEATFDLSVRRLPANRSFFVACGLEKCLKFLEGFSFGSGDIDFLKKKGIFPACPAGRKDDFLDYLKGLRFTGSVYALAEGTVFFPSEPILRVTAPILEAQIMESYLLNAINVATTLCSKASRVVLAAGERGVYDFSLRRTQGCSAALAASRSSYIAGCPGTSNVLASALYGIPTVGTMAHSFVMSFKSEIESFRAYASTFPENTTLLVDTYNYATGIENAITVGRELASKGYRLKAIRLDSGDLVKISRSARAMLDKAGLSYVKIFASGNLDEYKIEKLIKKDARIDNFGVGTNMGVSNDAPYLDVIYKLSQIDDAMSGAQPVMKLSKDKITYPGKKQVFRVRDKKGFYSKDIIGLEGEASGGDPLLVKVMEKGKIESPLPSLEKIRDFARNNIGCLAARYKKLTQAARYPVSLSKGLSELISKVRSQAIAG